MSFGKRFEWQFPSASGLGQISWQMAFVRHTLGPAIKRSSLERGRWLVLSDGMERIQEILGHILARHILRALKEDPLRYTEIQYRVTVSADRTVHPRTLTKTLKWLEGQQYIEKHHDPEADRYRLTELGEGCIKIIDDIRGMDRDRSPEV